MKPQSNKSNKFDRAVDRARGVEGENEPDEETGDLPELDESAAPGMLENYDPKAFAAALGSDDWEAAPQIYKLKIGKVLKGKLEGNGIPAEFTNKDTGVVKRVQTWIIASPDGRVRVSILSTAQLDKKLPPFVGGMVKIVRGENEELGNGHRLTQYLVAGPVQKDATGKSVRRDWTAIAAKEQRALPAGES